MKQLYKLMALSWCAIGILGAGTDLVADELYWTNRFGSQIQSSKANGSELSTVIQTGAGQEESQPVGITIDRDAQKLYWVDNIKGVLMRSNLDGTAQETRLTGIIGAGGGLALDVKNQNIYYSAAQAGFFARRTINLVDFTGSNPSIELFVGEDSLGDVRDAIALDVDNGKMYWTQPLRGVIRRANLDGSEDEIVIDHLNDGDEETDTIAGLALDLVNGKMYYGGGIRVWRASLDGTNVEEIIELKTDSTCCVIGIAIDVPNDLLYFVTPGEVGGTEISRATLSGKRGKVLIENDGGSFFPENLVLNLPDPVSPGTELEVGPIFDSSGSKLVVQFEEFGGAVLTARTAEAKKKKKKKKKKKQSSNTLGIKYELNISRQDGAKIKGKTVLKKVASKSVLSMKKPPAGEYTGSYRVLITKRKGKKDRTVGQTEFSPDVAFTID